VSNPYRGYNNWIELYNSSSGLVTLDGWYLSDDQAQWDNYQIPANVTVVGPYNGQLNNGRWADSNIKYIFVFRNFTLFFSPPRYGVFPAFPIL